MSNKKLTFEELEHLQREVENNKKSAPLAYTLSIFLGFFGIHRAYFNRNASAIVRSAITLVNLIILFMIVSNMSEIDVNSELFNDVLAYNAFLAISLFVFSTVNIVWSIVDLFLLPKWMDEIEHDIRETMSEKLIQARYVHDQLERDKLSEELIEHTKKKVTIKLDEVLSVLDLNKLTEVEKRLGRMAISVTSLENQLIKANTSVIDSIKQNVTGSEIKKDGENDVKNVGLINKFKESNQKDVENENKDIDDDKEGHEEKELTVKEAIENNEGLRTVKGFIIGSLEEGGNKIEKRNIDKNPNIVIADNYQEKDESKMLAIRLPRNTEVTSEDIGSSISVRGNLEPYFGKPGMKRITKISF